MRSVLVVRIWLRLALALDFGVVGFMDLVGGGGCCLVGCGF